MKLKESKFNFKYQKAENENIIYNTFSKALAILSDEEARQLCNLSLADQETINELYENGILINEDEDENSFLKYLHYKTKFSKKVLFLTIAPTLDCNFSFAPVFITVRTRKIAV